MKRGKPMSRGKPMAPGKPLERKTRLVAKQQPAKPRKALPAPTKPVAPVSAKRKVKQVERTKVLREMTGGEPVLCECCRRAWANDAHEILSRARGGDIADREIIAFLCRGCHTWITENPKDAEALGWSISAGPRPRIIRTNTGAA